jgi:hypothetical protein
MFFYLDSDYGVELLQRFGTVDLPTPTSPQ